MALKCGVSEGSLGRYCRKPNGLLLLRPRIRQRPGEAGDREIRRRAAIDDRRNDARRHEGEGCQQTDVSFALAFTLGNLAEGGNSPEPDVVDPSPGLSVCPKSP